MTFAYFDRVKETTATTGTGALALAGAVSGFRAFSSVYANLDVLHYVIVHASSGAWEVGFGSWLTGNQLTRTTVLDSSNAGALVNFAAGSKDVFVASPAGVASFLSPAVSIIGSTALRDAIPTALLRTGAIVQHLDTGVFSQWNGSAWVAYTGLAPGVPSQLPARGSENVVIDLYPNTQVTGTLASAASVNFDLAIAAGARYQMTWDIWVDNGAGGVCLYTKSLFVKAHQTAGAAVQVDRVVVSAPLESAGFTFDTAANSTNIRGTLGNTSGTTRSYNLIVGDWHCDKP